MFLRARGRGILCFGLAACVGLSTATAATAATAKSSTSSGASTQAVMPAVNVAPARQVVLSPRTRQLLLRKHRTMSTLVTPAQAAAAQSASGGTARAATATMTSAITFRAVERVAVIELNFSNRAFPFSNAQVETAMGTLNSYIQEVSYGKRSVQSTVVGPFTLARAACSGGDLVREGLAAADPSLNYTQFDSFYVIYSDGCSGASGSVFQQDTWTTQDGTVPMGWAQANINTSLTNVWEYYTHEFGHNQGLGHADGLDCGSASIQAVTLSPTPGTFSGGCRWNEYYDRFDTMGSGGEGDQYSAPHKYMLGFFDGTEQAPDVTTGTYTIGLLETAVAEKKALRIARWHQRSRRRGGTPLGRVPATVGLRRGARSDEARRCRDPHRQHDSGPFGRHADGRHDADEQRNDRRPRHGAAREPVVVRPGLALLDHAQQPHRDHRNCPDPVDRAGALPRPAHQRQFTGRGDRRSAGALARRGRYGRLLVVAGRSARDWERAGLHHDVLERGHLLGARRQWRHDGLLHGQRDVDFLDRRDLGRPRDCRGQPGQRRERPSRLRHFGSEQPVLRVQCSGRCPHGVRDEPDQLHDRRRHVHLPQRRDRPAVHTDRVRIGRLHHHCGLVPKERDRNRRPHHARAVPLHAEDGDRHGIADPHVGQQRNRERSVPVPVGHRDRLQRERVRARHVQQPRAGLHRNGRADSSVRWWHRRCIQLAARVSRSLPTATSTSRTRTTTAWSTTRRPAAS